MKTLRNAKDKVSGLRFIIDQLDLKTGLGNRFLMAQPFLVSENQLETEFAAIEECVVLLKDKSKSKFLQILEIKLDHIKDIQNTIKRVSASAILDDVELFEIKSFAIFSQEISALNIELNLSFLKLPNLQEVVEILDPDRQNIPHFYVYSSYSEQLLKLRSAHKKALLDQPEEAEEIRLRALQIEDAIREDLSGELTKHAPSLQSALEMVAHLDITIAKAKQATIWGLAKPVIAKNCTTFKGLFNPQVKSLLEVQQKTFQPIDIDLKSAPCLITGVNMGGKTVLLKTIGLAQFLFQFGFYVPATSASMVIVDQILLSIGDEQSELNGLSSFAAEMMNVDEIIRKSKAEKRILVLIDELARTTNPEEGKAIVNAALDILSQHNIRSLVTTHYSGLDWNGRKLRVKGLQSDKLTDQLTAKNINDFMDYSLIDNESEIQDKQALQIARLLGVDEELLEKATKYLARTE